MMLRFILLFSALLLHGSALAQPNGHALNSSAQTKVLLLHSYHPQYLWSDEISRGVKDVLETSMLLENLHIEYLDVRRYGDNPDYLVRVKELIRYKFKYVQPDIIVASDDWAFRFMLDYGEEMFPGLPVVFLGVNVFDPYEVVGKDNFTGILEGFEIEENLELIKRIQPDVERIVMIGSNFNFGKNIVDAARLIKADWEASSESVTLELWDDFLLDELYDKVAEVGSNTAFLWLAVHKDRVGTDISFTQDLPALTKLSRAPVYGMWGGLMIGNGAIGGMMNNPYEHGRNAALMAKNILQGMPVKQIPIVHKALYTPSFDYQQLLRFNVDLDRLPPHSQIVGKPPSLYAQYRFEMNLLFSVLAFMVVVIVLLLINIRQRHYAQRQLAQLNEHLEQRVEERTLDLYQKNQELEKTRDYLAHLANTDVLTELANRRAGTQEISSFLQRASREENHNSIALLDIDHFKKINDTFGHDMGDEVLRAFALLLKSHIRPGDRVYRWGGEEFLLFFPFTSLADAALACERIRYEIENYPFACVGEVTASLGLVQSGVNEKLDDALKRADDYLYKAKDSGRNKVYSAD